MTKKFWISLCAGVITIGAIGTAVGFGVAYAISDNGKIKLDPPKEKYSPDNEFGLDNSINNKSIFSNDVLLNIWQKLENLVVKNELTVGDKKLDSDVEKYLDEMYGMVRDVMLTDGSYFDEIIENVVYGFDKQEFGKLASVRFNYFEKYKTDAGMKTLGVPLDKTIYLKNGYIHLSREGVEFNNLSFSSPKEWFKWDESGKKVCGFSEVGLKEKFVIVPKFVEEFERNYDFEIAPNQKIKVLYFNDYIDNKTKTQIRLNERNCMNMQALEYIKMPRELKRRDVPMNMFENCTRLRKVNGLETESREGVISNNAFKNTGLVDVVLEENFVKINEGAFKNNKDLKRIRFGRNTSVFERGVLEGCENLERVEFWNSESKNYVFDEKTFEGVGEDCQYFVGNVEMRIMLNRKLSIPMSKIFIDLSLNDFNIVEDNDVGINDVVEYKEVVEKVDSEITVLTDKEKAFGKMYNELNEYVMENKITVGDKSLTTDANKHLDNFWKIINNNKWVDGIRMGQYLEKPSVVFGEFSITKAATLRFFYKSGLTVNNVRYDFCDGDVTFTNDYVDFNFLKMGSPKSWFVFDKIEKTKIKSFSRVGSQQKIVLVPFEVNKIENNAFANNLKTRSIYFHNSVCEIEKDDLFNGNYLCQNMKNLEFVYFGREFKIINKGMFAGCEKLSNLFWYNFGIDKINDYAFGGCDFKNIHLPANVKKLGDYVFADNKRIEYLLCSFDVEVEFGNDLFFGSRKKVIFRMRNVYDYKMIKAKFDTFDNVSNVQVWDKKHIDQFLNFVPWVEKEKITSGGGDGPWSGRWKDYTWCLE